MLQVIQYQKTGEILIEDLPDNKLAGKGILVQNYYSLISAGTERASLETAQASLLNKAKSRPDLVKQTLDNIKREGIKATYKKVMNRLDSYKELGYSCAGIVLESNVDEFKPGDKVACAGAGYASHAEIVSVPRNLAVIVSDLIPLEQAAFTTLASIALQGIRQANVRLGENVAVIGLGLIGLITVQLLKANGCRVIGLDISDKNFQLAKDCGCDEVYIFNSDCHKTVQSFTNGYGTDAVIITASTNSNDPIEKAINFARKKSRIVIVGVTGMNIPRSGFYDKELEITISCSYGPGRYDSNYEQKGNDYPIGYVRWTEKRNMEAVIKLLEQGKLDFSKLITHKIPIEEGLKAYDLITGKINEPYLGILIKYNQEPKENFIRIKHSLNTDVIINNSGRINIGFIGAGNFAQSYFLPQLKNSSVNLINVVTKTPINAKAVAQKFGFSKYSSDSSEIFSDENIDTIFITTHHSTHAKYVVEAIEKGKNIFVEKPLAINEIELNAIIHSYKQKVEKGFIPRLIVGFNRRFSKQFYKIKDFFKDCSEPFVINYRVNAGFIPLSSWIQDPDEGGRIAGEACHFIDIFDFIIDSQPVSIYAASIRSKNSEIKNEDNITITINYENGSIANLLYLANGDKSLPKEYCEIFSSGTAAIMDDFKEVILYKNGKKNKIKFDGKKGHKEELEYFIRFINGLEKNKLDFHSIVSTTSLTFKALESIKSGKIIRI